MGEGTDDVFAVDRIRRPIKAAIAWTIISEIVRRHGRNADLRLMAMHPGGGQYDLLRLLRVNGRHGLIYGDPTKVLADFNIGSGQFSSPDMEASLRYPWLERWMESRDPDDAIDEMLPLMGLDIMTDWPPTDRVVFGFRLVATILASQMTSRYFLEARNGFLDTSGDGGGVSRALRDFGQVYERRESDHSSAEYDAAAKCWLLYQGLENRLIGCVRMDGMISSVTEPHRGHDLYPLYSGTKKMNAVASAAFEILAIR